MSEFFAGCRAEDLVPGNADELFGLASRLTLLGEGMHAAASELRRIGADAWRGDAAEVFKHVIGQQPGRYFLAADAFASAAGAVRGYAQTLESAQSEARQAVAGYEDGQAATAAWQQRRSMAHAAGHHFNETDPGEAVRTQAIGILQRAKDAVDGSAASYRSALASAESSAPNKPGFFHRVLGDVEGTLRSYERYRNQFVQALSRGEHWAVGGLERFAKSIAEQDLAALRAVGIDPEAWALDFWSATPTWARHFVSGVWAGTTGMVTGLVLLGQEGWSISPTRLMMDPAGWLTSMEGAVRGGSQIAESFVHHPVAFTEKFLSAVVDAKEWRTDPARAIGELLPAIVVGILTAGVGTEADVAATTAEETAAFSADAAAEAETAQAARQWSDAYQAVKEIQNLQDAQGVVQAAQGVDSHTADGKVAGGAGERVGRKILPAIHGF